MFGFNIEDIRCNRCAKLDLHGDSFDDKGGEELRNLCEALSVCTSVHSLSLWHFLNRHQIVSLCRALMDNVSVKSLEFFICAFGDEGAVALAELLEMNRHIRSFTLVNARLIDSTQFSRICAALKSCCLEEFVLSGRYMFDEEARALGDAFGHADCRLVELALCDSRFTESSAVFLGEMFLLNCSIQKVTFSMHCFETAAAFDVLCSSMSLSASVKSLTLSQCSIFSADSLRKLHRPLRHLSICKYGDTFDRHSPMLISSVILNKSFSLISMNLSDNIIDADIWNALEQNTTLQNLIVAGCTFLPGASVENLLLSKTNRIVSLNAALSNWSEETSKSIVTAFASQSFRSDLDISQNKVDFIWMGEFLKQNQTIQRLRLRQCSLSQEDLLPIAEGLKINTSLTELEISIDSVVGPPQAFVDAMRVNGSLLKCPDAGRLVESMCERNRIMHQEATKSVLALLSVRRLRRTWFDMAPREVVQMIALCLLKTKVELNVWWRM